MIITIASIPYATALQNTNNFTPHTSSLHNSNSTYKHTSKELNIIQEGEYDGIKYKIISDTSTNPYQHNPIQPRIKLGAGKYLYLYVNTAEFHGLTTAAGAAYTGVICGMIATGTGGIGGIACGAITQGIFSYLRTKHAPGPNQCGEIKLIWGFFGPAGYKVINKPCNKI